MLTEYGKVLRKIRIDRNMLLKEMADSLEVTASYLSAVEHGKREIPLNWTSKISELYHLSMDERNLLEQAADQSRMSITLKLDGVNAKTNTLVNVFARKFENLNQKDIDKMMDILTKEGRD